MDELDLLIDLHADGERQGPGSPEATRLAIRLSGLGGRTGLRVADIGCGTGASALILAADLDADVEAVDLAEPFLARLRARADAAGLGARIHPRQASMDDLPFAPASLDAMWSEGAVYQIGFAAGVRAWRRFLRPGGVLAVSELTWLTPERPPEVEAYWSERYPEVGTPSAKMAALEAAGYAPIGYFPLPEDCWTEHYHGPLRRRLPDFVARHGGSEAARRIAAEEEAEVDLYAGTSAFWGYGFYLARHLGT